MAPFDGLRALRFALVTGAHELILAAVPFRHPCSRRALAQFVAIARTCDLPSPDLEAVLLRCLSVLEPHTGGRLPSLVDRFLGMRRRGLDAVTSFHHCVEDVIQYRGVGNRLVQEAIGLIEAEYSKSGLSEREIAARVGLEPGELGASLKNLTNFTFAAYLRGVRLDRAALLLSTTEMSIKEIWAAVGYNHASNFDHDFKHRFGMPPRTYRARALHAATPHSESGGHTPSNLSDPGTRDLRRVLIVDDNQTTRDTVGRYLQLMDYRVAAASTGRDGLQHAVDSDVVVLDHHLPDMDGLSCLRALRKQQPGALPPVVLFSADLHIEDHGPEIRALGATVLSKLCDLEELERVIGSLCAMQRQPDFGGMGLS